MYLLSYHVNPNSPIPSPPNIAKRLIMAVDVDALPVKALFTDSSTDSQAWPKTSIIKNIKIPTANALRKPFFFRLKF